MEQSLAYEWKTSSAANLTEKTRKDAGKMQNRTMH